MIVVQLAVVGLSQCGSRTCSVISFVFRLDGLRFYFLRFAVGIITDGYIRLFSFFRFHFANKRHLGFAFVQDGYAFYGHVSNLIVVDVGDASAAFEIVNEVLSGAYGARETKHSVGGYDSQVAYAAFAFNINAEREFARVGGVPFPMVVAEIAKIST